MGNHNDIKQKIDFYQSLQFEFNTIIEIQVKSEQKTVFENIDSALNGCAMKFWKKFNRLNFNFGSKI